VVVGGGGSHGLACWRGETKNIACVKIDVHNIREISAFVFMSIYALIYESACGIWPVGHRRRRSTQKKKERKAKKRERF
jgi:hypothetical protein